MIAQDPIRKLAEEIQRCYEADLPVRSFALTDQTEHVERLTRSTLPELSQLLGELAVAREALEEIANKATCIDVEGYDCRGRWGGLRDRGGWCASCVAADALASDSSRLAGELIRAVGDLASRVPREPAETPRAARGKLLETAVEVDRVVSRYDDLLAAFPGLREVETSDA